jgi:hypothetical protein
VWKTRGSKGVVYVFQVPGALRDGSMKYYERPVKLGLNDPVPFIAKDWMMSEEREGLIRHLPSGRSYLVRHDGAADIDGFFAVDNMGHYSWTRAISCQGGRNWCNKVWKRSPHS